MAKATEAAKFLSYKVCDMADMDYEECRTDKKKIDNKFTSFNKRKFRSMLCYHWTNK